MAVSKVVKSNGDVIMDISQDTVNANNLLQGATAHGSDGEAVQGAVIVAPTDVTEVSDTTPYLYKTSEHDAVYDELVGGSVAWNQLVQNGNFESTSGWGGVQATISAVNNTLTLVAVGSQAYTGIQRGITQILANHVIIASYDYDASSISNFWRTLIQLRTGSTYTAYGSKTESKGTNSFLFKHTSTPDAIQIIFNKNTNFTSTDTITVKNFYCVDLTQMFGSTIADYVYNLEQSTAGSGIAWLKSYGFFTKDYYAYNAGGLVSVNTSGKKVVGKNLLIITAEPTIVNGVTFTISGDGTITANGTASAETVFYTSIFTGLNGNYLFSALSSTGSGETYDAFMYSVTDGARPKKWDGTTNSESDFGQGNCQVQLYSTKTYRLSVRIRSGYTCNNLVFKPMIRRADTDSTFEPYTSLTYPIQSTDLRGLYKLNGSKLYTDGDIYSADGTVTRKYGYRDYQSGDESLANAITDGTHTIYKLSAPTTTTAPPLTSPQIVYRNGTEEYLDTRDVPMPVGGNRKYVDIPEWMVNEYFDDVRAEVSMALPTTGGTINGDLDVNGLVDVHSAYVRDDLTVGENLTVYQDLTVNPDFSINCRHISRTAAGRAAEITLETLPAIDFYVSDSGLSSQLHFSAGYFGINDATMIYPDAPSGTGTSLALDSSYNIVKVTSSRDTKHDINYVEDTNGYHDALMQLKPATFIYNSDKTETQKLGMIAEDVADVCPIAGMTDKGGKVENYDDRAIITLLVAEVQRLNAEIDKLKGR